MEDGSMKRRFTRIFLGKCGITLIFFPVFILLTIGALNMTASASEYENIRDPRFTPDGKSIVFDRCLPEKYPEGCRIHVYNLETGALSYFQPPEGQEWMQASYSAQGDKVVFALKPPLDRSRTFFEQRHDNLPKTQIAVMNADGSNVRVLTDTPYFKGMPVFSHSGKKIAFVQAERLHDRPTAKTIASNWDLWELDLDTGKLNLFAGQFKFYQMGMPSYFPDDRRVLINGDTPFSQIGPDGNGRLGSSIDDYSKRYRRNKVFEVERGQVLLNAPLFLDLETTQRASLDYQGNAFFIADGGPKEGLRIRRATVNDQIDSWNFPPGPYDWGASVSGEGKMFAMIITKKGKARKQRELIILDTTTGVWRDIALPREATTINR